MEEKKYRILQVHNYYQIPGGEDTVVANEKKMLENNGHIVIQYVRHNSELNTYGAFKKLMLPFKFIFSFNTYKEICRIIDTEHIDVLHVHNTLSLISPSVYYAALKKKVPVVQTIHNFRLLCPGATFYRDGHICEDCMKKGLMCAVRNRCYRGSFAQSLICVVNTKIHRLTGVYKKLNYICLTEFNKEKLLELKQIKSENVFIKPNFVSDEEANIISKDKRKKQIVFSGRIDSIKGIEELLKAWVQLEDKQIRLILCGSGPMESWCREFINSNKISNVEIRGYVDNKEVKRIVAESMAMILPTKWYEGFPMTIAEAYSVGTPVIGSNFGNVGDLIIEGKTGVKVNCNSENWLQNSIKEIESPNYNPVNIKEYYDEKYKEERNYSCLLGIYDAVTG